MVSYSTNWMGPIRQAWCNEHGDYWSGGRIDIYGVPGEHYPIEYGLPIMHSEDWNALSYWLDEMQTEELWTYEKLIEHFQYWYKKEIRWWKDDNTV